MPSFSDRVLLPGIRIGHATDPGVVRAENQDSLYVPDAEACDTARRGVLVAVADGMGGHAGGALASRTAVETLAQFYIDPAVGLPFDLLALQKVERAHERIQGLARERPQLKGMGTTLTVALIAGRSVVVFHVGDSRCYLFRGGELKPLTSDHTLAARWAQRGAPRNPMGMGKSVLTRALGVGTAEVDREEQPLAAGDRLLLASDGLHGVAPEGRIVEVLASTPAPWDAARQLVELAKECGGPDNVTAVVVLVD
jgi:protein phosphatase